MATEILMPELAPQMVQANLLRWLKKEGDAIKLGDIIAEIETDKAVLELESAYDGTLTEIVVPAGSTEVPIHTVIARLAKTGERVSEVVPLTSALQVSTEAPKETAPILAPPAPEATAAVTAAKCEAGPDTWVFASPRARRVAKAGDIDLATVRGTGPRGRILECNVLASVEASLGKSIRSLQASSPAERPPVLAKSLPGLGASDYSEILHDGMRKSIARRLLESKQTIPHFYLSTDCELDEILSLKDRLNQSNAGRDGQVDHKFTVNDFIIKAFAVALARTPEANVSWTENALRVYQHVDVGIAVTIPGGLITPIIRQAEAKALSMISREVKELAIRAKARKLKPSEYEGGTTSISNLGMFGVKSFSAIINPPQATILAVGAGEKRVVVKNDLPAVATVMTCTLSVDHRALDGVVGARLLREFKSLIEDPLSMLVW